MAEEVPCNRAHPDGRKGHLTRMDDGSIVPTYPCTARCAGLVDGLKVTEVEPEPEPDFELKVEKAVERLEVEAEAKRRIKAATTVVQPLVMGLAANLDFPPVSMRIKHLLMRGGNTLVVAQAGTAKTTLLTNLTATLLSGEDSLGVLPTERIEGRVGILSFETAGGTLKKWLRGVGADLTRVLLVDLRDNPNAMQNPEQRDEIAKAMREHGVEVLMVDTFARAYTGDSDIDAGQVGRFLTDLHAFARVECGASELVLTAHAGWSANARARGSSALYDWPDNIVVLTKDAQETRFIETAKSRDDDGLLDMHSLTWDPFYHRLGMGENGTVREHHVRAKADEWTPRLVESVRACDYIEGFKALKAQMKGIGWAGHDSDLRATVKAAAEAGLIRVEETSGRATRYYPGNPGTGPVGLGSQEDPGTPVTPGIPTGVRGLGSEVGVSGLSVNGGVPGSDEDDDEGAIVIDLTAWSGGAR